MNAFWAAIFKYVASVLFTILSQVSPEIKSALNEFLTALYKRALATENIWDDFFVGMLLDILSIPRPPPET